MVDFGLIYPSEGRYSFSIIPAIVLDRDDLECRSTIEVMWLFWGFYVSVYSE